MSDIELGGPEGLAHSLVCQIGVLEKGDVVAYEFRGERKEAFFVGSYPDSAKVKVRKTESYYEDVDVRDLIEKVENPEVSA